MNIAIVYQYYQSCDAPGHALIYEWSQYLAQRGHRVVIIAGSMGYMQSHSAEKSFCQRYRGYRRFIRREKIGLVEVIRTYTYDKQNKSYSGRVLSLLSFSISCLIGLCTIKKPDLVFASSPPLFPMIPTRLFCKLRRLPLIFEVRDLWPESVIQTGMIKNQWLIKQLFNIEKKLYLQAQTIIALTKGIQADILQRYPEVQNKLKLIHYGVNLERFYADPNAGQKIIKQYHLENKKIILYLGALGFANNITVILNAAKYFAHQSHHSEIIFMLVGDGIQRGLIESEIQKQNLHNILLLPPVANSEARKYINAASLCVVTLLDIPIFQGAIPTKLIDYMACGKPVLCGIPGEAKEIVEKAQAGYVFEPNDDKTLSQLIIKLLADPERANTLGYNGLEFIRQSFSSNQMNAKIETALDEVL